MWTANVDEVLKLCIINTVNINEHNQPDEKRWKVILNKAGALDSKCFVIDLMALKEYFSLYSFGCLVGLNCCFALSWFKSDNNKNKLHTYPLVCFMHLSIVEYLPRYCISSICHLYATRCIQAFKHLHSGIWFAYDMFGSYIAPEYFSCRNE